MASFAVMQTEMALAQGMSYQQQVIFLSEYRSSQKDSAIGVLLAFFLGGFGAHRFYMGEIGLGLLYAIFCWTCIPGLIALFECFLMPGRVHAYNWQHAHVIAAQVRATVPA